VALSSPGIGSNLDINSIVNQLMSVEQQPLVNLTRKEASFQAKLSAIGNLKGALSTFQGAVRGLVDTSKFQATKVTAADTSIVTASGTSAATPGSHSLEVSKLAQAQKLVAAGQASSSVPIGTGTITFDFGTISGGSFDSVTGKYSGSAFTTNGTGSKTVSIGAENNSLAGIRDAINAAKIGVTASIVNDGGASPYRLVLTETSTGKTNSMKISVSGDAALGTLLSHDPAGAPAAQAFSETVAAQNADFKLDGIAVSKSSNTITDAIPGVTLTLTKTNTGSPTTVSIARDSTGVTGAVGQFVFAYNQINQTLRDLSSYNPTTRQAGILNGDATVRSIQSQLRSVLNSPLGGSAYSSLSEIGVTMQKDGTLAVDNAKLQKAVESNLGDIASMFAATGKASDSLVTFTSGTDKTKAGTYPLSISQIATQGKLVGGAAAGLTIDATNDTFTVALGGVSADITIAQSSYASATALAAEVQAKINGASAFSGAGLTVTVTESAGVLTITSSKYGSDSTVSVSGTGKDNLVGASPTGTPGLNVAGTINGIAATGSGEFLTGATGDVEGLKIHVGGTATGSRGAVSYAKGYAYQLDKLVSSFLDVEITSRTDGLNASIKSISKQKQQIADRLTDVEKRYRAQFTALDTMISSMNKTSSYLTQQLANLPKIE
jgi:flagellar hook-associated protein 2